MGIYCYVASARRLGAHGEGRGAGAYCVAMRNSLFIVNVETGRLVVVTSLATVKSKSTSFKSKYKSPRASFGVVRMDPLRFLAGCHTSRLNQV